MNAIHTGQTARDKKGNGTNSGKPENKNLTDNVALCVGRIINVTKARDTCRSEHVGAFQSTNAGIPCFDPLFGIHCSKRVMTEILRIYRPP